MGGEGKDSKSSTEGELGKGTTIGCRGKGCISSAKGVAGQWNLCGFDSDGAP